MILITKLEGKRTVATTKTFMPSWTCDYSTQDTSHIMQVSGERSRRIHQLSCNDDPTICLAFAMKNFGSCQY